MMEWNAMAESVLTGKVPICREDFVELDCTPNGGAASDAAEAEKGGGKPLCSSGGVEAHDHEDWREDEGTVCECVEC
jgi:hypothetical protein